MIEHSAELKDLAGALAKAQGAIEGAKKGKTNPHFKSKYADLESIWDACRGPLTDNGLSVSQWPGRDADGATLTTMLLHSSGQWIKGTASTALTKNDAQGVGSALTYLRRYALAAVASVAPEDDDGNAASERSEGRAVSEASDRQPTSAAPRAAASGPVTLETLVNFGKYKGKPVKACDPDYFHWVLDQAKAAKKLDAPTAVFSAAALNLLLPETNLESLDQRPAVLDDMDEDRELDKRLAAGAR